MEFTQREKTVVDFAYDIIKMADELGEAKREIKTLQGIKRDYNELLNSSIKHSEEMIGNTLKILLNPEKFTGKRAKKSK